MAFKQGKRIAEYLSWLAARDFFAYPGMLCYYGLGASTETDEIILEVQPAIYVHRKKDLMDCFSFTLPCDPGTFQHIIC